MEKGSKGNGTEERRGFADEGIVLSDDSLVIIMEANISCSNTRSLWKKGPQKECGLLFYILLH